MPTAEQMYDEAIELREAGRLEEAVGKLEALIGQAPDYALAHAGLSVFHSQMDRHDEAVKHAQKVCELEPEDPFSYIALSLICQKAGLIMEAEQAMMRARQAQMAGRQTHQE